jgi:hypothetical protein
MPTTPAAVGDLWIQPNGTAPPGSPGEGEPGPQGEPGIAATIEVAETLTIDAGLPAEVVNVGNENKARFSFKIPRGENGSDGAVGPRGEQGQQGIQGQPGLGIRYVGTVATQGDLPATSTQGDLYVVSTPEPARGFVWDETKTAWQDSGPVQGPQGVAGPQGVKGDTGETGSQGIPGKDGAGAVLVPATSTVLGGVKIGSGVTVTADGTISVAGGGSTVTNPVAGSAAGLTIWIGTQTAYDAIATKDSKTLYHITG